MELITPSFGMFFWMLIGFGLLFFILAKFAWPFITKSIAEREKHIEEQLAAAESVRQDMRRLKAEHQELIEQAKEERDQILADARKMRDTLYADAKEKSNNEAQAIIEDAKKTIYFEKMKAVTEIKNEIANMSIEIAEKLIGQELSDKTKQEKLISDWIQELEVK
ncbi:MAG: F0F1 ATP synthase subunit B [Bacteroidales bacterium]|jgi:F-type H+-transporting ATPase subunit b|nr:F0F1 ATP synthase subunit B [Bacteroidales bacterium]